MVGLEALFVEELSGMAIIKILNMEEQATSMTKLKFIRNKAVLKITNKMHETVTFGWTENDRSCRFEIIRLLQNKARGTPKYLGKHYHFKLADDVCNQYNRFVNLMRKEEENSEGKYPWLEDTDKRKYMTDREILDKYINLDNSCLTKIEKTQVRELLYKCKDALSLRDKIGLWSNIEIEIDVTNKSPFFIRPLHANEEDKMILDKEMK